MSELNQLKLSGPVIHFWADLNGHVDIREVFELKNEDGQQFKKLWALSGSPKRRLGRLEELFEPQDLDKKQGPAAALSTPLTAAGYIAFHLVVFSQREEPLKSFLSIGESNPMTIFDFLTKNDYGNTALHEAAANGNIEAVKLLVNHINELSVGDYEHLSSEALEDKNNEGETSLLRAAAYGKTKVVNFLASKSLADETALELLELDESLPTMKMVVSVFSC
ncbi:sex-determining protein fem-1-like [Pistacia vera]|uniref:sex-determining protein fem-1-like n=1 Tax=Pistacia vera TaxID=55513 RepID=UPI001262D469|nr:sex-determining protein fem-1-like [Pistacia vera]